MLASKLIQNLLKLQKPTTVTKSAKLCLKLPWYVPLLKISEYYISEKFKNSKRRASPNTFKYMW